MRQQANRAIVAQLAQAEGLAFRSQLQRIRFDYSLASLAQVDEVLLNKFAKRGVDIRSIEKGKSEKIGGDKVKRIDKLKEGLESELAKKVVKLLKDSKMKVTGSIQGTTVRVSGNKKDDLQAAMALIKKDITELPLQFNNFRD